MDAWKSVVEKILQEGSHRKEELGSAAVAEPTDFERAVSVLRARKCDPASMSSRWSGFESAFNALHPFAGPNENPISWRQVGKVVGVPSIRDVGECVYPLVGFAPVSKLHDLFEERMYTRGINMPERDNISPYLDKEIVWLARRTGAKTLYLSDFSGDPLIVIPAEEFPSWRRHEKFGFPDGIPNYPVDMVVMPPTLEWLAYTEYESLETEFFGARNLLEEFVRKREVEGWWSMDTRVSVPAWYRESAYPAAADFIMWGENA